MKLQKESITLALRQRWLVLKHIKPHPILFEASPAYLDACAMDGRSWSANGMMYSENCLQSAVGCGENPLRVGEVCTLGCAYARAYGAPNVTKIERDIYLNLSFTWHHVKTRCCGKAACACVTCSPRTPRKRSSRLPWIVNQLADELEISFVHDSSSRSDGLC